MAVGAGASVAGQTQPALVLAVLYQLTWLLEADPDLDFAEDAVLRALALLDQDPAARLEHLL